MPRTKKPKTTLEHVPAFVERARVNWTEDERARRVVESYLGVDLDRPLDWEEIAEQEGISTSTVPIVYRAALPKLMERVLTAAQGDLLHGNGEEKAEVGRALEWASEGADKRSREILERRIGWPTGEADRMSKIAADMKMSPEGVRSVLEEWTLKRLERFHEERTP